MSFWTNSIKYLKYLYRRYGGATTLATAGHQDYIVTFNGIWAGGLKAMKRYIRTSDSFSQTVSPQLASAECSLGG
jgi:hypothetical protein